MFDSMIESRRDADPSHSRWAMPISMALHVAVIATVVVVSWLVVEAVRDPDLVISFMSAAAPPPPPPPPPPPAGSSEPEPQEEIEPEPDPEPEEIVQPIDTPEEIEIVEASPGGVVGGVEGGVEGGVVGGEIGGVIGGEIGGVLGGVLGGTGPDVPIIPTPDVQLPVNIHKIKPDYPDVARAARLEGKVYCQAVVDSSGNVTEVTVLRTSSPLFRDNAIAALKQWKYEPAVQNGRAISVYITVVIEFTLH